MPFASVYPRLMQAVNRPTSTRIAPNHSDDREVNDEQRRLYHASVPSHVTQYKLLGADKLKFFDWKRKQAANLCV